jgi:CRP/FNR family transcriptional regulator, cyclic AMP receptor protein
VISRYSRWRAVKVSAAIRLRFKLALLERIPLFEELSTKETQQIGRLVTEIEVPAGTKLAKIGEPGGELFAIVDGEAIVRTKPGRTAVLKAGDFFGEMSLIDGQPRSATVEAKTPIRLLVLDRRDFFRLLDTKTAIARKVMQTLCGRLREAEGIEQL